MKLKLNKRFILLIVGVLTLLLLAACGQDTEDNTTSDESQQVETEPPAETEAEPDGIEEPVEEEETEPEIGTRSNPVPLHSTATIDSELYNDEGESFPVKFDLTVTEVMRGESAYEALRSMNEFNDPAPEGYEWVLAKTKVNFVESETEDLSLFIDGIMNFDMVSESGDIYSGDIIGTTDPDFSFEMYVGSEKEGYIADLVKTGEDAQLRYEEMVGGEVFFELQ